ncbi:MAG: polymer-forming cytoskeletal protein [Methanimicrococcus sp.]|nr:polymer-forming cytoskeletal protein [Methanimicrococcus sp.]
MISSKNIRFHATSDTYIIPKNSLFDDNLIIHGNVIVGSGSRFWKNIKINGNIQFGKGVIAEGNVEAADIIIGPLSRIKGKVSATGDVSVFQKAVVQSIVSGGTLTIMEGCEIGYADGKRMEVIGKADIQKIGDITKVTVRAFNVAAPAELAEDFEEDFEEGFEEDFEENIEKDEGEIESNLEKDDAEVESNLEKDEGEIAAEAEGEIEEGTKSIGVAVEGAPESSKTAADSAENEGVEIIESGSSTTPQFQLEKKSKGKRQTTIDPAVPEDEMPEVELLPSSNPQESAPRRRTGAQKTVVTPFGVVAIDDDSDKPDERGPAVNAEILSAGPETTEPGIAGPEEEKSERASLSKSRPWPAFDSNHARSGQTGAAADKRKKEARWVAVSGCLEPASQKEATTISISPDSKAESGQFQYEEVKVTSSPAKANEGARANAGRSTPENLRKANQKIVFEEIEPETKPVLKSVPPASVRQKPAGDKSSVQSSEILENKAADEQPKAEPDSVDRKAIKTWYEQRFKPVKTKRKEYPPYI